MPVGSIFGAERYKPSVTKKAEVPQKSVGVKGSIWMTSDNARIALMRSAAASANVFSARAQARALVNKDKKQTSAVPLIARTTSASPDNVAGLNRPYIQVLSLSSDPGMKDATRLKTKSNFYDTFIINSVNLVDAEKLDVVETFGNPHFFSSGRFTKKAVISGVVRSQARTPMISTTSETSGRVVDETLFGNSIVNRVPDYVVFRNFYDKYLRATLQASSNTFTRVFVDGDYYDGFVQNLAFNLTAESEQTIQWYMSMLLLRSWNAEDNSAASILSKFMDDLKIERTPITDREALLELQDTKGNGKIAVNGKKSHTDILRKYVNGEVDNNNFNIYIELSEANLATVTVKAEDGLASAVTLVTADGKELNGQSLRTKEKMYLKLKVTNVANLTEFIKTKTSSGTNTPVKFSVYANDNTKEGCNITFPVEVSGGDGLQIQSATYLDQRTNILELKAAVDTSSSPINAVFTVPQEKIPDFFAATGDVSGKITLKLAGKAGNAVKVSDVSKVSVSNTSDVRAVTSSLAPSGESVDGKCSKLVTGTVDPSNLSAEGTSELSFEISSSNPAFASSTNPFTSTEKLLYSMRGLYNIPGYEESAVEIQFIIAMPTPDALKGVVTGKPETRVVDGIVDIRIPIAKSAFVAGELPSATMAKLNSYTARLSITIDGNFDLQGTVLLAKGSSGVFRSSDQGGHISGKVSKAGILTNEAEQVYVWRAKIDVSSSAYLYANYRITQAKAVLTNDPFKSAK